MYAALKTDIGECNLTLVRSEGAALACRFGEQVNFEKAQASSRNDEADLREVARKAAKKSQQRNH